MSRLLVGTCTMTMLALAASPARAELEAFELSAGAGASYLRLFNAPLYAADMNVGFGARFTEQLAFTGEVHFFPGRYLELTTDEVRGVIRVEGVIDRFRLGAGGSISYTTIARVSEPSNVWRIAYGVFVGASLDLIRIPRDHAIYVAAQIDKLTDGSWGPSAVAGFRY